MVKKEVRLTKTHSFSVHTLCLRCCPKFKFEPKQRTGTHEAPEPISHQPAQHPAKAHSHQHDSKPRFRNRGYLSMRPNQRANEPLRSRDGIGRRGHVPSQLLIKKIFVLAKQVVQRTHELKPAGEHTYVHSRDSVIC